MLGSPSLLNTLIAVDGTESSSLLLIFVWLLKKSKHVFFKH